MDVGWAFFEADPQACDNLHKKSAALPYEYIKTL